MAWKLWFGPSHLSPWHFICCCFSVFHQSGGQFIHNFDECQVLPIPIIKHEHGWLDRTWPCEQVGWLVN
jgi:hypothetical protein